MKLVISLGALCAGLSSLLTVRKSAITTGLAPTLALRGGRE